MLGLSGRIREITGDGNLKREYDRRSLQEEFLLGQPEVGSIFISQELIKSIQISSREDENSGPVERKNLVIASLSNSFSNGLQQFFPSRDQFGKS